MSSHFTESVRLPRASGPHPGIPIASIGRALARALDDTFAAPLPESLAALVRRLEEQDSVGR